MRETLRSPIVYSLRGGLAVAFLIVLLISLFFGIRVGAQGPQTTNPASLLHSNSSAVAPKGQAKRLTPLRISDTLEGSRVTITSDAPLNDYTAYRSGDRFYVIIPQADAVALQSNMRGRGFADMQVLRRGNDVVLLFFLQPGTTARVNPRFNQLDVAFAIPGGSNGGAALDTKPDSPASLPVRSDVARKQINAPQTIPASQPSSTSLAADTIIRVERNNETKNAALPKATASLNNSALSPVSSMSQANVDLALAPTASVVTENQIASAPPSPTASTSAPATPPPTFLRIVLALIWLLVIIGLSIIDIALLMKVLANRRRRLAGQYALADEDELSLAEAYSVREARQHHIKTKQRPTGRSYGIAVKGFPASVIRRFIATGVTIIFAGPSLKRNLGIGIAMVIFACTTFPIVFPVAAWAPSKSSASHQKRGPATTASHTQKRLRRHSRAWWRRHHALMHRRRALALLSRQPATLNNNPVAPRGNVQRQITVNLPRLPPSIIRYPQDSNSLMIPWRATAITLSAVSLPVSMQDEQQGVGTLHGQITDQLGGVVVGATVTVTNANGVASSVQTNAEGIYTFNKLPFGRYTVRASAQGFAPYEQTAVEITSKRRELLNIKLTVALEKQVVTVDARTPVSVEPENNLTSKVLRGKALEALPSNQRSFIAALRAMAVPSSGPTLGSIYIDGFTNGRIPPKEAIREVRINENPFSAEYDKLGFGRIEIFTKPGADKLQFGTFFNFNDESLNARNPLSPNRAPFQSRLFGGNVTGPLFAKRASFFMDFEREAVDDNAVINATILDPLFRITPLNQALLVPEHRLTFSPRFDYQLNNSNTLVARYSYARSKTRNTGLGYFNLPSSAYNTLSADHTLQLTETAVLNQNAINETRFQFIRGRRQREGDNSSPTISVEEAFIGGGAKIGKAFNNEDRWELQNYTTLTRGHHNLKGGGQLHGVRVTDFSTEGFNGEFSFGGGLGPQLDANNRVVYGPDGDPVMVPLTSIERYRRTLLFQQQGLSPNEIRELGGGASQFMLASGNPLARVSQYDFGAFVQDDWRLRQNFTLSPGLRYEAQNNIRDWTNLAPRLSFAWAPGANAAQPKTVIRGGIGIFYDRFSEELTLEARRANGINQQQFIISNPTVLDLFPNVASIETLANFAIPSTITRVATNLRTPYTAQSSISIERQLPHEFTLAATFANTRTLHLLRTRNINAPLPGTYNPEDPNSAVRPLPNAGEILQYESSGIFKQNQLTINLVKSGKKATFYATYVLNKARSDTDGVESSPANPYDLRAEYGRSSLDARHQFYFGGWMSAPWGIDINTLLFARSALPFNIITGYDVNGDRLYTERPAFATDLTRPSVITTRFGAFDLEPIAGQRLIPRNYGIGPSFFSVNLDVSKTFTFGHASDAEAKKASSRFKGPYSLTLAVQVENLLNHTNLGLPVGSLSSSLFGQSYSTAGAFGFGNNPAGNRRVQLQLTFNF